ncbi:MAG: hypothetical protein Q9160_005949 [Pyrenula sp. 1 TL-2023]
MSLHPPYQAEQFILSYTHGPKTTILAPSPSYPLNLLKPKPSTTKLKLKMSSPSLNIPGQQEKGWYARQKESWMPWIEDHVLSWFGENKASYVAKDKLSTTKQTNNSTIDAQQDSLNSTAASQLGKGGSAQVVGDAVSRQGANRAERRGKGEGGGVF